MRRQRKKVVCSRDLTSLGFVRVKATHIQIASGPQVIYRFFRRGDPFIAPAAHSLRRKQWANWAAFGASEVAARGSASGRTYRVHMGETD